MWIEYNFRINGGRILSLNFSRCHEYSYLGFTVYSKYQAMISVVLNTYIKNISEEKCEKETKVDKRKLKKYFDYILDSSKSEERIEEFFCANAMVF